MHPADAPCRPAGPGRACTGRLRGHCARDDHRRHPRFRAALPEAPWRDRSRGPWAAPPSRDGDADRCPGEGPGAVRGGAHLLDRLFLERQCHRLRGIPRGPARGMGTGRWRGFTRPDHLCRVSLAQASFERALPAIRPAAAGALARRGSRVPAPRTGSRRASAWSTHPRVRHRLGLRVRCPPCDGASPTGGWGGRGDAECARRCRDPAVQRGLCECPRNRDAGQRRRRGNRPAAGLRRRLSSDLIDQGAYRHTLGAAGAIESVLCLLALSSGFVPATTGLEEPDPEIRVRHVPPGGLARPLSAVVSNSFGFGGNNTALVFSSSA